MAIRIRMGDEDEGRNENPIDEEPSRQLRRQRYCRATLRRRSIDVFVMLLSLLLISLNAQRGTLSKGRSIGASLRASALVPRMNTRARARRSVGRIKSSSLISTPSLPTDATKSPLFSNRIHKTSPTKFVNPLQSQSYPFQRKLRRQNNSRARNTWSSSPRSGSVSSMSSPTALHMVLTTPESIIEQASTVNLLDDLINESVRTSARRPIMMQFDPSSGWIWRRWKGTVFAETWTSCARNMIFAFAVYLVHRSYPHLFNAHLSGFNTLWGQLLSVTTFTLTFFVNQSYALWRKCMELSRRLQGRLHDVNMNMASHAERVIPANPNEKSTYTAASRQILELMSRYTRLFNLLTYASFTRSHRPILTPRGLRRLVERGLITAQEREVLVDAVIPATQRHSVVLMWMIRLFVEGRASGHIQGGHGFESETMHKFHIIRSQYGAIGDELQGRMPLAYAHIVQVLVDSILWMFPIMAFSTGMSPLLVVFGTGLLTMSYQGLFDLAKQFLDPYDNESYGRGEDPLCVDTLIAETNAGSIRWLYGFEELPFSAQRLNDGELYEYLLPVRGYSVEELDEMERERIEREKQLEEQRKREDEEAAAAAEAERMRKEREDEDVDETETETEDENVEMEVINEEDSIEADSHEEKNTTLQLAKTTDSQDKLDGDDTMESTDRNLISTNSEIEEQIVSTVKSDSNNTKLPDSNVDDTNSIEDRTTTRPVHTVTTLANGSLTSSFTPSQQIKPVVENPVPSGMQASTYLATLRKQNEKIKSLLAAAALEENGLEEEVDFEAFEDLPWFDEVGPDGQEFRLSQQLADEDWVDEKMVDVQIKNMTKEEYEERLKEIEENAEIELKETIEVMSAIPGVESEPLYTITERRKKKTPKYDQTRLDGISQLWGLPPEDPASLSKYEPPEKVDDVDLSSISQLWGGMKLSDSSSTTRTQNVRQDDSEIVGMGSFAGISELWGPSLNDFENEIESEEMDPELWNETRAESEEGEGGDPNDFSGFGVLPWHDERGPDGQEYRLSQMLADEEWVSERDPENSPMTFEDYKEQVKEITEKLEEEMRETEAILLSKPGTDPVGWDYDDDQLAPMSNVTDADENEEEIGNQNKTIIEDADLAVLEMDVEAEDDGVYLVISDDELDNGDNGDAKAASLPADTDSEVNDVLQDVENAEASDEAYDADDVKNKIEPIFLEEEELTSPTVDDDNFNVDGKNKIEPIFLEGEETSPTVEDGEDEDEIRI